MPACYSTVRLRIRTRLVAIGSISSANPIGSTYVRLFLQFLSRTLETYTGWNLSIRCMFVGPSFSLPTVVLQACKHSPIRIMFWAISIIFRIHFNWDSSTVRLAHCGQPSIFGTHVEVYSRNYIRGTGRLFQSSSTEAVPKLLPERSVIRSEHYRC